MMTLDKIFEIIKQQKKPFLSLKFKNGYNLVNAGNYQCENSDSEASIESKTEKAIEWLAQYTSLFPDESIFVINMKASNNANGTAIAGPFEFSLSEKANQLPVQNMNGLNGLTPPPGYVHESELKARILEKELEFQNERNKSEIQNMKKDFSEQIELVKQTAKEWNPDSLTGLAKAIGSLLGKNIESDANLNGSNPEPTAKQMAAKQLADLLTEKLSLDAIEQLKQNIFNPKQENPE
jgi:hypothetical protein